MDCSPPDFSIHGIFQARVLEWVAISFSRGSSWPRDWTQVSRIAGRCFTIWATRESQAKHKSDTNSKSHTHTFKMESHFKKLTRGYKDVTLNTLWYSTLKIQMQWGNLNRVCVCAQSLQLCLILWDPIDCSSPDSSVHGIFQARVLEWGAIAFSGFKLWCWWILLRVPWTAGRSNQSILKEINPQCSLKGLMLKLNFQYFSH